jgi:hypothetical protein
MTTRSNWQDRKHSAHTRTRYFSGGWEFDTAQEALDYVSTQYAKESLADRRHTPFKFSVKSNGVQIEGWHGSQEMELRSTAYRFGGALRDTLRQTMRDTVAVPSPSDCIWIVPGTINS